MRDVISSSTSSPHAGFARVELAAPFLLAMILRRMNAPEDYWRLLLNLRDEFTDFRTEVRAKRDDRAAGADDYIEDVLARLQAQLERSGKQHHATREKAFTAAEFGVNLATANLPSAAIGAARLLSTTLDRRAHEMYIKRLRPDVYLLLNLAREAERLRSESVDEQVRRIWGRRFEPLHHDVLDRFARLQADPLLSPRTL